jgi:hypothetical protein
MFPHPAVAPPVEVRREPRSPRQLQHHEQHDREREHHEQVRGERPRISASASRCILEVPRAGVKSSRGEHAAARASG